MTDPAYWRAWRAAHPEYRARQNKLRNERRARNGRGDRTTEYATRPSRAQVLPDATPAHTGHELFDQARAIVGPRKTSLTTLSDPLYDDLIAVATLAILEGTDPEQAVKTYRTQEQRYGRVTAPLHDEAIYDHKLD